MADWEAFSELQGGEKVQELGSRVEDRQTTTVDDTTEGRKDLEEEEIEEEIEIEEEEFQRAEEISVDAGEGEEEVMLMLDDTYEDDFEETDDDEEEEDEQPEAEQETIRAETRKRKHDSDDDNEDSVDDKDGKKDEAAKTVPRVEDVRNFVETLVGNAVRNLEAEVAARHRQIQESGEGQELTEGGETGEELQGTDKEVEEEIMEESSSEDKAFPELSMVLDGPRRDALFEKGVQYQNRGRLEYALKCYLGCLKDLDETEGFSKLPQCLHQIADTFYRKEEYDKAVQFIQAEKMYYENALIDTSELQKSLSEATKRGQGDIGPPDPRVLRAMEFENLARMCVQRKKPQLALEYCGKAVKAYQTVLGDDHPATTQCLDYFTVIYAEAGRKEYSDAMGQFQSGQEETKGQLDGTSTLQEGSSDLQQNEGATAGETSEVRRRAPVQGSAENGNEEEAGQVYSEQEREVQDPQEQTDDVTWLVLLLVFLITLVLTLVGTYLYCQSDRTSSFCSSWRSDLNYYYMSLKYKLHSYLPAGWGRG
ncbi:CNST [Branchiostoma lanceolatum]|uniref:CNST protein n=1 Tax=Branchiostoma lanceolatum TaxID=7740 RepID=A0A8K0EQF1_BRALA|nr:CNST [Branchiostoma lanceolatum]